MKDSQVKLEKKLLDRFFSNHPTEAVKAMYSIDERVMGEFLESINPMSAAKSLQKASSSIACRALENMEITPAARIMQQLPFDTQLVFINSMKVENREAILDALPDSHESKLRRLLNYPVGSAGYHMDPTADSVLADCPVGKALETLRTDTDADRYYVYVTDSQRRLVGIVTLQALLKAQHQDTVASIMSTEFAHLPARASERDIIRHPLWRDYHELPVINRHGVLLGAIRYETLNRLKAAKSSDQSGQDSIATVIALSELYWLGMTGFLDTISTRADDASRVSKVEGKPDVS